MVVTSNNHSIDYFGWVESAASSFSLFREDLQDLWL